MISEEQFENANKILQDYMAQKNKSLIKNLTCVCCKTNEIEPLKGSGLAEGLIKPTEQERGSWDNGVVEKISVGYGSRHDMKVFFAAICDDCISDLEDKNLIIDLNPLRKEELKYRL